MPSLRDFENWILNRDFNPVTLKRPIVAHFWNGGASTKYEVRSVSPSGAFILANDQWCTGTIISMTFQYDAPADSPAAATPPAEPNFVRAKVTNTWPGVVEVEFVFLDEKERLRFKKFLAIAQAQDR
jgi:hypothetical protein